MSGITSHILDTARGKPAAGVSVVLAFRNKDAFVDIARAETDADGRIKSFPVVGALKAGTYRLVFATDRYFRAQGNDAPFYPEVAVTFVLGHPQEHYHVPLLLSPFGYSTYRGS